MKDEERKEFENESPGVPADFEEAHRAARETFEEEPREEEPEEEAAPEEEPEEEAAPVEKPGAEEEMLADSVQTAVRAAQTAAASDESLQRALREIERLQAQNEQLNETVSELSRENEKNIIEDITEPPSLDVNALAFADGDTVKEAQAKYANDMAEYSRKQIMKELSPFIEQAKEGMYEKERNEVVSLLAQIPELGGIDKMVPQLEAIIKGNRVLSSDELPTDEKLITAYAIARGVNSINTPPPQPKEQTAQELFEIYKNNPDLQSLIEKERVKSVQNGQQVPKLSAGGGAAGAALNIKEKPKTIGEASSLVRKIFGAE